MASVTLDNVLKSFGDTLVIRDFNIDIQDGEFIVFVGPSGSGKSTMLRIIAGLESLTEGEIYIGDKVVSDLSPRERDIAMVFQNYALFPHMSVFDNMAYGLKKRNTDSETIKKQVNETAKSLEIEDLLDRNPTELSGGQQQRVALGRAIVRDPQAFLLDEPLSNLDAKLRVGARAFLNELHDRLGATFIYVTHDQVEAMTMGDRIAVLGNNFLQQIDTPEHLYRYPDNVFVAGFIGSPSMNFFDAKVCRDDGLKLETNAFTLNAPEDRAHLLEDYIDQTVIIGIRPENIHHVDFQPSDINGQQIEAEVGLVEMLGDEKVTYLKLDGIKGQYPARIDFRAEVERGDTLSVVFDLNTLHLFGGEDEVAIRDDPKPGDAALHIRKVKRSEK